MRVSLSTAIIVVCPSLSSTNIMVSNRSRSNDTIESETGDVVEQVSMILPFYEDTKLFIDKEIKMKWQDINDNFQEHLMRIWKTIESMSTFTSLAYSGLHAGILRFHE